MKKYAVSEHAIKRAVERLGQPAFNAGNHLNHLMQTAFYNGETPHKSGSTTRVFDHYKSRTRIIVSQDDVIVTTYKLPEFSDPKPTVFIDDVKRLISRQFAKAKRDFTKQRRALEIELAELNVTVASMRLNMAKARSPKVRAAIATKIDALQANYGRIEQAMESAKKEFDEIKRGTEAYL